MTPNMMRLSVMMFLQFFMWGTWYVSMTGFINASDMTAVTGAAYMVGPLAAIIAPFFLTMIADRYFSSERVLGTLHLLGGAALLAAPFAASPFHLAEVPADAGLFYTLVLHDLPAYVHPFVLLLFIHMLCYMPTLALTVSLSFNHLENQERQFPYVRVLGTIGWIAGNWVILLLPGKDASAWQFYVAGGSGILLGLYSFSLPHTPAPLKGTKPTVGQILGLDSLRLMKSPSYAVFIICSFLLCIPLAGYYQQARNFVDAAGATVFGSATTTMSFGQMSEVFFMLIMPLCFVRLGVKNMLAIGMLAWVVRYGLFALGADDQVFWMILFGILLHGVCYDFFFVTGMIYADKRAPKEIRNQAQGFLVLVTQGLGLGLGSKLFFGHVLSNTSETTGADWYTIWIYPAVLAGIILVIFYALFWDRVDTSDKKDVSASDEAEHDPVPRAVE